MIAILQAAACLLLSAGLMWWLDTKCRKAPLIELMRFPGNDEALHRYQRRMDAAGEAPVRNVREVES